MKSTLICFTLMGMSLACSKGNETSVCGARLPEAVYDTLPPIGSFSVLGNGLGLRWQTEGYEALCSSAGTRMDLLYLGTADSVIGRVEWRDGRVFRFALDEVVSDRWKGSGEELPLQATFDNNPGSFGFSIDFYFSGAGSGAIQTLYDHFATRFQSCTIAPIARYQ
ncbi:hypothetical protein GC167_03560 [bacterium]|nr:hypothetical protein [bacterium]